jgi:peptidoglycan L-alanyl-D-glutamate endopeptidase CwlK
MAEASCHDRINVKEAPMASPSLDVLVPEAREKAVQVADVCEQVGFKLLIYCTLRTLEEQAKLYRQSRSWKEIKEKILTMKTRGYGFLADIIDATGPCNGPHVTNAAPGESWHNYAQAWDAVPLIGGKPAWNYLQAKAEWDAYGECVRQVGMIWAGDWVSFREYPHAQLRAGGNPLKEYEPDKIRQMLIEHKLLKA